MKKHTLGMLLLTGSLAGCFTWPHDSRSPAAPIHANVSAPLPAGPITADQVEAVNAHRVAEAVWDELDRDQQNAGLPPAAKKR